MLIMGTAQKPEAVDQNLEDAVAEIRAELQEIRVEQDEANNEMMKKVQDTYDLLLKAMEDQGLDPDKKGQEASLPQEHEPEDEAHETEQDGEREEDDIAHQGDHAGDAHSEPEDESHETEQDGEQKEDNDDDVHQEEYTVDAESEEDEANNHEQDASQEQGDIASWRKRALDAESKLAEVENRIECADLQTKLADLDKQLDEVRYQLEHSLRENEQLQKQLDIAKKKAEGSPVEEPEDSADHTAAGDTEQPSPEDDQETKSIESETSEPQPEDLADHTPEDNTVQTLPEDDQETRPIETEISDTQLAEVELQKQLADLDKQLDEVRYQLEHSLRENEQLQKQLDIAKKKAAGLPIEEPQDSADHTAAGDTEQPSPENDQETKSIESETSEPQPVDSADHTPEGDVDQSSLVEDQETKPTASETSEPQLAEVGDSIESEELQKQLADLDKQLDEVRHQLEHSLRENEQLQKQLDIAKKKAAGLPVEESKDSADQTPEGDTEQSSPEDDQETKPIEPGTSDSRTEDSAAHTPEGDTEQSSPEDDQETKPIEPRTSDSRPEYSAAHTPEGDAEQSSPEDDQETKPIEPVTSDPQPGDEAHKPEETADAPQSYGQEVEIWKGDAVPEAQVADVMLKNAHMGSQLKDMGLRLKFSEEMMEVMRQERNLAWEISARRSEQLLNAAHAMEKCSCDVCKKTLEMRQGMLAIKESRKSKEQSQPSSAQLGSPQPIVDEPNSPPRSPQPIVDEPSSPPRSPQPIVDEPSSPPRSPQPIVDEPSSPRNSDQIDHSATDD
ncbi:midasin-like isoform X2 [Bacillus rossius redtenbacheri]|uniref:midasin-like isoform X2 n=1 Tax=Bacillus rossius redtenbacheri TaxID=93214 RepID=UPI002FDD8315